MTVVAVDATAEHRLQELGLTTRLLVRVLLRADAEARITTAFDPPTAEGSIRYFRTVRFLREELAPLGWDPANYRNFCRTVHRGRGHSIVTSSGDEFTGQDIRGVSPSTKYPKGDLTELAVRQNADQDAFDFGEEFDDPIVKQTRLDSTWFLLQHVTSEYICSELSLPTGFDDGVITDWQERIILPRISREGPGPNLGSGPDASDDEGDAYSVDVALR